MANRFLILRYVTLMSWMMALSWVTAFAAGQDNEERPNILWLSTEDIGPHLGCYGDPVADTPNLDALAERGMLYEVAWSNYPVCAPARTTIISGMYAAANGAGHMRCSRPLPDGIPMFPQLLRNAGYYCTNKAKEDYNHPKPGQVWDNSGRKADFRKHAVEQPFFGVVNHTGTHESKIRSRPHQAVLDPAKVELPPYCPTSQKFAKTGRNTTTISQQWTGGSATS